MAIRRKKLDRQAKLQVDSGRVIDLPPGWAFTIDCEHHGPQSFDFTPFRARGRDEIAGHLRDALWSLRRESTGETLNTHFCNGLVPFWRFVDEFDANGEAVTHLAQVDRKLIDRYLAWLELQLASTGKNNGQRLSVGTRKNYFDKLKSLLVNRQKRVPAAVSPELTFPRNPFPRSGRLIPKRDAYSVSEEKRITAALNTDLRAIHEHGGEGLAPRQILAVHLLVLGLSTGRNKQPLLELRRDSLRPSPVPGRELLFTQKRRGYSSHTTSSRASGPVETALKATQIPDAIGGHFRFLASYTEPLVAEAGERDREFVFLYRPQTGARAGRAVRLDANGAGKAVAAFATRHGLLDDRGRPLALNIARLRPTFADNLYRASQDVRRVQQALGHSSPMLGQQRYLSQPLEAERDHAIVLDSMVCRYNRIELDGKVLIAADGQIPLADVEGLLGEGYATGIARCRNPFREGESVCKKFFACFRCPQMIVFEDDLWRLFSFYYRLLAERAKLKSEHWMKTYAPIIRRIDRDITPQFPAEIVEAARQKAQQSPHPTWRGPLQ